MKLYKFEDKYPNIDESAYIQDGVRISGAVNIHKNVNIWFNSTLRGDLTPITIHENTNIQELTTIHSDDPYEVIIGKNVTIGHNCIIHGAIIHDDVLVGMGSTLLNGCVIGKNCLIGAGSLVTQNTVFEEGMLIVGRPAKAIRALNENELKAIKDNALEYIDLAKRHQNK